MVWRWKQEAKQSLGMNVNNGGSIIEFTEEQSEKQDSPRISILSEKLTIWSWEQEVKQELEREINEDGNVIDLKDEHL